MKPHSAIIYKVKVFRFTFHCAQGYEQRAKKGKTFGPEIEKRGLLQRNAGFCGEGSHASRG